MFDEGLISITGVMANSAETSSDDRDRQAQWKENRNDQFYCEMKLGSEGFISFCHALNLMPCTEPFSQLLFP